MARFEGEQSIPSELLDKYRQNLNPHPTGNIVKKRYPYRMRPQQTNNGGGSQAQRRQREIFNQAIEKFKNLSATERARWYASEPPISSFLWYFNWFMLNAIPNLWGVIPGGAAILKGIQNAKIAVPDGGAWATFGTAVDPAKCVIMLYGNGYTTFASDEELKMAFAFLPVYPIYYSMQSSKMYIDFPQAVEASADISYALVEYI